MLHQNNNEDNNKPKIFLVLSVKSSVLFTALSLIFFDGIYLKYTVGNWHLAIVYLCFR